jgi:hypothetical protein
MIGSLEMDTWLSARMAWIRNQVPVIEITAMNQIDQMPLSDGNRPRRSARRGEIAGWA